MADFMFQPTVPTGPLNPVATCLFGADGTAPNRFTDIELGKGVKLAGLDNYVLAADGDELEGIVLAVDGSTINEGFSWGSVLRATPTVRLIARNGGAGAIAVGAYVLAAAQQAIGTANLLAGGLDPVPNVKAGAPAVYKWRVISLLGGAGAVNSQILIERQ